MYGFGSGGSKKHTIVTLDTPRLELEMMHRERNRDKGPRARSQKQELQMMMLSEFENLYERSKMSYEAEYDQGRLIRNTGCLVTACIGIGFSVTAGFLSWNGHKQVHSDTAEVLRTLSSLFSIFLALQICEYHRFKVSSIFKHYVDDAEMPWTAFSKDLPILVVELLVCLWHVPPFCSSYIPDKWMFPMFLRLYLMLRYLRDISPITRNKGRIISHGFYHLGGTSFNAWIFHARTFIYRQPGRLVMITTGILYLMMSYCIYLFERERQPDIFDFGNSLWYTAVAMTTVGYGDIVAKTDLGRLFAVMSGAMGIFLSTFCVTVASSVLTLSKHQKFANDIVSWQELEKKRIDSAATVIQAWWRLLKLEQNGLSDLMSTYRNRRMLLEASGRLRRYRKMRKNISTYGDDPVLLARLLLEGRFDPILDRVLRVERTANALEKKLRTLALLASDGQTQITSKQPGGLRSRKPSIVPMNLSTSHNVPFGSPSRDESDQLSKILSKLESFDRRLQTIEKITAEEALPSLSEMSAQPRDSPAYTQTHSPHRSAGASLSTPQELSLQIQNLRESYASLRSFAESLDSRATTPPATTYASPNTERRAVPGNEAPISARLPSRETAYEYQPMSARGTTTDGSARTSDYISYKRFPSSQPYANEEFTYTGEMMHNRSPDNVHGDYGHSGNSTLGPGEPSDRYRLEGHRTGSIRSRSSFGESSSHEIQGQMEQLLKAMSELQSKVEANEKANAELQKELYKERMINQSLVKILEQSIANTHTSPQPQTPDFMHSTTPPQSMSSGQNTSRGYSLPPERHPHLMVRDLSGFSYDAHSGGEYHDAHFSPPTPPPSWMSPSSKPSPVPANESPLAKSTKKPPEKKPQKTLSSTAIPLRKSPGSKTATPDKGNEASNSIRSARSISSAANKPIQPVSVRVDIIEPDPTAVLPDWRSGLCYTCRKPPSVEQCTHHSGIYGRCACHDRSVSGGIWTRSTGCPCRNMKAACSDCKANFPVPRLFSNLAAARKANFFHKNRCDCWCHRIWSCCGHTNKDNVGCVVESHHQSTNPEESHW